MNIKLKIKSLDRVSLDMYLFYLKSQLQRFKASSSLLNLPSRRKLITLLKSPHVNKTALEQFSLETHSAIVVINSLEAKLFLKFILLNKPKHLNIVIETSGF